MRYRDLAAWLDRHAELEARWRELWVALPEGEAWRAGLGSLSEALRLHVAQEEATLLPAWARLPDPPPNATAEVLLREHRRLLGLLDELAVGASRVERAAAAWTLREVLHHHDRREATSMKPGLDRALPPELTRAWLDRFEAEEGALPPPFRCEPGGRTAPDSPEPEEAIAADAPVTPTLARVPVPVHPKGPRLHARLVALAAEVDATADPRARRERAAELWGALRLVRIVGA